MFLVACKSNKPSAADISYLENESTFNFVTSSNL